MDSRLIARIARVGGARLIDLTVGKALPDAPGPATKRGIGGKIVGAALVRIATRSVPGAILVGGGLLAKTLYDRRKRMAEEQAAKPGD
jgi:hypothetical protein